MYKHTKTRFRGFSETISWAARRAAHEMASKMPISHILVGEPWIELSELCERIRRHPVSQPFGTGRMFKKIIRQMTTEGLIQKMHKRLRIDDFHGTIRQ